jgi:hypothetical protein
MGQQPLSFDQILGGTAQILCSRIGAIKLGHYRRSRLANVIRCGFGAVTLSNTLKPMF